MNPRRDRSTGRPRWSADRSANVPDSPGRSESDERDDATDELTRLAIRAAGGDRNAVQDLITQVYPLVVRYCRARLGRGRGTFATADDVAQEVCIALLDALPRFKDQGRPFAAFVYGIASHKVVDAHRVAGRDKSEPSEELPETAVLRRHVDPEEHMLAIDATARLRGLLSMLSARQREIIVLRVGVGMSAAEVGVLLDMSAGAVRVTQHRALARLRALARRLDAELAGEVR